MKIQDHEEIIEFSVANIGQKDLFIGHDWLQHHNLEINWQEKQIKFSRCPVLQSQYGLLIMQT
jgi:hypothetical protein